MKKTDMLPGISELPLPIDKKEYFNEMNEKLKLTTDKNNPIKIQNEPQITINNVPTYPNRIYIATNLVSTPVFPMQPIFIQPNNCLDSTSQIVTNKQNNIPHIKGSWSHEEDKKLKEAVQNSDPIIWDIVATKVPGRTPIQCKERWLYRLHPDVKKTKFEKWEDDLIIQERNKVGNSWTYIATKLPGRTSCAVKNRYYSVLRKRNREKLH